MPLQKAPFHPLDATEHEIIDQPTQKEGRQATGDRQSNEERGAEDDHQGPGDVSPQHVELAVGVNSMPEIATIRLIPR